MFPINVTYNTSLGVQTYHLYVANVSLPQNQKQAIFTLIDKDFHSASNEHFPTFLSPVPFLLSPSPLLSSFSSLLPFSFPF
jgi:hypothetical protein